MVGAGLAHAPLRVRNKVNRKHEQKSDPTDTNNDDMHKRKSNQTGQARPRYPRRTVNLATIVFSLYA